MNPTTSGPDDEVVAVVEDDTAARPVIEALLLAGLGPTTRPGPGGSVEVTVVAGQGERAVEVLAARAPGARPFPEPPPGTTAPHAEQWPRTTDEGAAPSSRDSTFRILLVVAVALFVIPALAFYISYKASGG